MRRRAFVQMTAGAAIAAPGPGRAQQKVISQLNPGAHTPDEAAVLGRAFYYVGKILNGADPAEMPVERPTEFILAVNLKAAAQLGLTVPPSVHAQATEVTE